MPDFKRLNDRLHHFRFRPGRAAPAIVFANSLGTDLRIWDNVIEALPAGFPILTYDKSGHGLSETGAATIEDFAADLAALMDELGLQKAMICGVSVGGMIAQTLAFSRPELVAGLVLCNTSHCIGTTESWAERIKTLNETDLEVMVEGILERWFSGSFHAEKPDLVAGYRMMLARTPKDGYLNVCAAIRDADLTQTTSRLTCPTLCVSGSADQATPTALVKELSRLIDGSEHVDLDDVGHLPCIEVPETLAALLRKRLEGLV